MPSSTVICAVADDDRVHDVVATARALAERGGLRPLFAHVAEPAFPAHAGALGPGPGPPLPADVEALRERALADGRRLLAGAGLGDADSLVVVGDAAVELDRLAVERDAALVIVGTHRRGALARMVAGSVSRALIERGSRPVLVARDASLPRGEGPVIAAVDTLDDDAAGDALGVAAWLAGRLRRPLLLATVLGARQVAAAAGPLAPPPVSVTDSERRAATRALERLAERPELADAEIVALEGTPIGARLDELASARGADLLVVGGPRHGLLRRMLEGSVALGLARTRGRPLVVVPRDGG